MDEIKNSRLYVLYQEPGDDEPTWFTCLTNEVVDPQEGLPQESELSAKQLIMKKLIEKLAGEHKDLIHICFTDEEYQAIQEKQRHKLMSHLFNYRIPREEMFMRMAELLAERSTCTRAKVGALLVRDNHIISTGYVGAPSGADHCLDVGCLIGPHGGCIRTVHAESNVLAFACKEGICTKGSTLYVTLSPCLDCAKQLINAGIERVVYLTQYRDISGIQLLEENGIDVVKLKKNWFS